MSTAGPRATEPESERLPPVRIQRFSVTEYHRMIKAGIPEYWLVVVRKRSIEILRAPDRKQGVYRTRAVLSEDATLTPAALPGLALSVRSLFD
jgi:Uma2 family endonuclease